MIGCPAAADYEQAEKAADRARKGVTAARALLRSGRFYRGPVPSKTGGLAEGLIRGLGRIRLLRS